MELRTHLLKTWTEYFDAVLEGRKTFEVRWNDRDFQVGDLLILKDYDPESGFTGRRLERVVTYVLDKPQYVREGFVVLGMLPRPEGDKFLAWRKDVR